MADAAGVTTTIAATGFSHEMEASVIVGTIKLIGVEFAGASALFRVVSLLTLIPKSAGDEKSTRVEIILETLDIQDPFVY